MLACGRHTLPASLQEEDSSFCTELEKLVTRYVEADSLALLTAAEWAIVTDPATVLVNGRVSTSCHPALVYNTRLHTLTKVDKARYLPLYFAFKKHRGTARVEFQARTNNSSVTDCSDADSDKWRSLSISDWLPVKTLAAASKVGVSWVDYFRSVTGVDSDGITAPQAPGNGVEMKLSSILLMFLKSGSTYRSDWPDLREDGAWVLPPMVGNEGKDEHVFLDLSEDVLVRVA